jgi:hypothetical protein
MLRPRSVRPPLPRFVVLLAKQRPDRDGETDIVIGPHGRRRLRGVLLDARYTRTAMDCVLHMLGVTPNLHF